MNHLSAGCRLLENILKEIPIMGPENEDRVIDKEQEKAEEKLPFCTTAPSAEHARGDDEDEPCEDFRDGD
jgi:hypothetical protein